MTSRESRDWLARARRRTPEGSHTMAKAAARFVEGVSPAFAARARGAWLYDADGRAFIDWIAGLGSLTLGSAHPAVVEAVARQARDGSIFSLPHTLECAVAERLCDVVPCGRGGMVRWVKTGSEACAGAIRVARIATGRPMVLVDASGYHGWHDWFAVTQAYRAGIPEDLGRHVMTFRSGDLDSFETALASAGPDRVAAVLIEPAREALPSPGYLEHLRRRTREIGALLVFDELRLGFRLAVGGGQAFFEVTPDLATFGKSLAGGLPLAALIGPEPIMRHAAVMSGTFNGDCLALAAAEAVLDVYEREPIVERVWRAGSAFVEAFGGASAGLPVQCRGLTVNPLLAWEDDGVSRSLFVQEMARSQILIQAEAVYPCAALGEPELERTRSAIAQACDVLREALAEGDGQRRLAGERSRRPFSGDRPSKAPVKKMRRALR
jgi:glutamate-1-semialdehyde 2,1-aminomutase